MGESGPWILLTWGWSWAPGGRPDMPPGSGFPSSLGTVATRALAAEGLTGSDQLPQRTERELPALHGVGPQAIRILGEELVARGLRFRDG